MNLKIKTFMNQNYDTIKKDCRSRGKLFRDPKFRVHHQKLNFELPTSENDGIKWLRPKAICSKQGIREGPKMFVGDFDRFDINQGAIGNCWLLAALANLAESKEYFNMVVPQNQDFDLENYQGIFRFRFWVFGQWKEVVIDDRLPTLNGRLIYLTSRSKNEFWSALLEKAYAKLYGSYNALSGGMTVDAAVDFTGGIPEQIDIEEYADKQENLFAIMAKADKRGAFMGCALKKEADGILGLLSGHAYTLNKVHEICPNDSFAIPLVRLRNPHGNHNEWKGEWSDGDERWDLISKEIKEELKLASHHDGEFYMSFRDFVKYFKCLDICHISPNDMEGVHGEWITEFEEFQYCGAWKKDESSPGGSDLANRSKNPQFFLELSHSKSSDKSTLIPVIVSLYQKQKDRQTSENIGWRVYKCSEDAKHLDQLFVRRNSTVARSKYFSNLRESSQRLTLPPGKYCIMPLTLKSGVDCKFLLRIFVPRSRGLSHIGELTRLVSINSQGSADEMNELKKDSTDSPFGGKSAENSQVKFRRIVVKENATNQSRYGHARRNCNWANDSGAELKRLLNIVDAACSYC